MDIYSLDDLGYVLPILFLLGWACVLLLVNVLFTKSKGFTALLTAVGLVVGLVLSVMQIGTEVSAFNDMLTIDGFAVFLHILIQGSGLLAVALSYDYMKRMGWDQSEYYVLMLFSLAGAMLMASAANLIVVFLALEMLSIPLYVLAAIARKNAESEEAGLKYFLLGAFAGGFLLYGIALVYGATAETNLAAILAQVNGGVENQVMFLIGAALILIGLGFKVAVVPFHMWTPDVYQGAPTSVTAYMAVIAKAGGFAALLRIFIVAFPSLGADLEPVIWGVVVVTLLIGNLAAIAQKNIKRMFAYSSISHAGFMMMAFITFANEGVYADAVAAVLFYLLAFAVTSFGSWAVVIALEKAEGKGLELDDYAGLGKKYPAMSVAMLIFLLSFAGVPPTLGFGGKFYVFRAVLESGNIALAVIGVLASLISAYYYLRVVIYMYFKDGDPETHSEPALNLVTLLTALGTIVLFFTAGPILQWAADSVLAIL